MRHDPFLTTVNEHAGAGGPALALRDLVPIRPLRFLALAASAIAFVVAMALVVMVTIDPNRDRFLLTTVFWTFWVDAEHNVPTFLSFLLIGFSALLLGIRTRVAFLEGDRLRHHWLLLAVLFVAMAFDEAAQIHETVIGPLRHVLATDGVFFFAWVIPALVMLSVLGLVYLPFLIALPTSTAFALVGCGAVYVGGAVGAEMVGGVFATHGAFSDLGYRLTTVVEETCEMLGIALFATTLLAVLRGPLRS